MGGEVGGCGARDEVVVWIQPLWQVDDMDWESEIFELKGQLMSRRLPRLVIILIEDDVDTTPGCLGKLRQVGGAQMGANGAGSIAKASLPQYGQIEQTSTRITMEKCRTESQANKLPLERVARADAGTRSRYCDRTG